MKSNIRKILFLFLIATALVGCDSEYNVEEIGQGNKLHTFHGMDLDDQGRLYIGSLLSASVYRFDTQTAEYEVYVGNPQGQADDMEFSADGTLYWTSMMSGKIHAKKEGEPVRVVAEGYMGFNAIAFNDEGRLFASLGYYGTAVLEIDPAGIVAPKKIADLPLTNGFDFGPDGKLYTPVIATGQIVKIDVDTGEILPVAQGLYVPSALNFDSQGNLYVLEAGLGHISKIDINTGAKEIFYQTERGLDNLAFDANDNLYASNCYAGTIERFDTTTGERELFFASPGFISIGGLALYGDDELHVSDYWVHRVLDANTVAERAAYYFVIDGIENVSCVSVNEENVVISGWASYCIQKRNRKTGQLITTIHGMNSPYDSIELEDGSILVAEYGSGRLLKLLDDEGKEREVVLEGLEGPVGLAKVSNNEFLLTEFHAGTVSRVNIVDKTKEVIVSGLDKPEGVALDSDGNIFVAETGKKRLIKICEKEYVTVIREIAEIEVGMTNEGVPAPYFMTSVSIASDGTIYVPSDIKNLIYKISPAE